MDSPALWERIRALEADNERLTQLLALRTGERDDWHAQTIVGAQALATANTTIARLQSQRVQHMPSSPWADALDVES